MESYESDLILEGMKKQLLANLPRDVEVSEVEFEGPFIVIYTRQPDLLFEDPESVKNLAKKLRKRIVIRTDPSIRLPVEVAEDKIKGIVPEDAEITSMDFDELLGEVVIEAKKPGIVIGQNGNNLRNIAKESFWRPTVVRTLPTKSSIISRIREIYRTESALRRSHLLKIGRRIHRPLVFDNGIIRVTGLGGTGEIGRSAILVSTAESRVLVDCGMAVGTNDPKQMFPYFSAPEFDIENLDAVIITHAHLDHSGLIPYLYKYGYDGPVYCNNPTLSLMTLLQRDYLKIAAAENKLVPYASRDIVKMVLHMVTRRYNEVTDITGDMRLTFSNAGHILGSSIVHLHIGNGKYNIAFANDFKYSKSNLLPPANSKFPRLEAILLESTYGSPRDNLPPRRESERQLLKIVQTTIRRGGKVLIPTLAVGRAQELIVIISNFLKANLLPEVPIYLDGMIAEATAIHSCYPEYLSKELQSKIFSEGENPFLRESFVPVETRGAREEVLSKGPCIILATSGMLNGGASVEYFHKLATDDRNSIIFVSYQSERSLGKRVSSGTKEIRYYREGRMRLTKVNMDVHTIEGFSGHSDHKEIMNYINRLNPRPRRIILAHGNEQKSQKLAQAIQRRYNLPVSVPKNLETIRLA